jgi:hypothetical protein
MIMGYRVPRRGAIETRVAARILGNNVVATVLESLL